jgi:cytochrome c
LLAAPVQAESCWYDQADIDRGATLYKQNCASCHGQNGEGTADWKKTDANGNYPSPPLNGTPSLYKSNGENIQGYVPYKQLIQKVLNN